MRDEAIDLCGQVDFTRTDAMPLLERDTQFHFACAGCGNCCRGREDIVLSGYDLWRIAARLRLPPQIVARGYCRSSIGRVSHLPVLRLAPVKENRNNCPFLTENHCAIHEAEPLVCALYPLAQEISRAGEVLLGPVLVDRMQAKLWQALYFGYDYAQDYLPQLEANLRTLDTELHKLTEYQKKRNNGSK